MSPTPDTSAALPASWPATKGSVNRVRKTCICSWEDCAEIQRGIAALGEGDLQIFHGFISFKQGDDSKKSLLFRSCLKRHLKCQHTGSCMHTVCNDDMLLLLKRPALAKHHYTADQLKLFSHDINKQVATFPRTPVSEQVARDASTYFDGGWRGQCVSQ
jgi:hypothetical protein